MEESNFDKYINKLSPETLSLVCAESDEEFDKAFDICLIRAISDLEKNCKEYKSLSENGLSSVLASTLTTGELSVTREEHSNGHVDLTVKLVNSREKRTKLGEAKIWRGKEYHVNGIGQLLTRYITGRECRGFVISYVKQKNIKKLFEDLREYIDKNKPFDLVGFCKDHNIKWSFISEHEHSSGEQIEICSLGCNLFCEDEN